MFIHKTFKTVILLTIALMSLLFAVHSSNVSRTFIAPASDQVAGVPDSSSTPVFDETIVPETARHSAPPIMSNERGGEKQMPRYHVTIIGKDYDALADLVRKYHITVMRSTARMLETSAYRVDAVADSEQIRALEANGYQVQQHEDVDEAGKAGLREVGQGNRYEQAKPK